MKASCVLACVSKCIGSSLRGAIFSLSFALKTLPLEHRVRFMAFSTKKVINKLEGLQWRMKKLFRQLERATHEKLKELVWSQKKRRLKGILVTVFCY